MLTVILQWSHVIETLWSSNVVIKRTSFNFRNTLRYCQATAYSYNPGEQSYPLSWPEHLAWCRPGRHHNPNSLKKGKLLQRGWWDDLKLLQKERLRFTQGKDFMTLVRRSSISASGRWALIKSVITGVSSTLVYVVTLSNIYYGLQQTGSVTLV